MIYSWTNRPRLWYALLSSQCLATWKYESVYVPDRMESLFSFLRSLGLHNVLITLRKVQYEFVYYNQCYWELISVFGMQVPALVYACSFLASIVLQVYLCTTLVILYTPCEFEHCRGLPMLIRFNEVSGTALIIIEVVYWFAVCLVTLSGVTLDKFSAKACVCNGSEPVGVIWCHFPSSSPKSARDSLPSGSSHWHRKCFYAGVHLSTMNYIFIDFPVTVSAVCRRGTFLDYVINIER